MPTVVSHPLTQHWLAELRDVHTPYPRFRQLMRSLSAALFLEASRDLPVRARPVLTPLCATTGAELVQPPVLVPILRAGIGMADGILELLPECRVCHVGIYREHDTQQPQRYFVPGIEGLQKDCAMVLDPMIATGGSAAEALELVAGWGMKRVKLLGILAAPEGVQLVQERFPDVEIYLCALDERLNEVGYIVPGLGDAGDRQFGG